MTFCPYDFSPRSRVDVDVGRFVKIAVNHEVVQLLDEKSACVNVFPEGVADYDGCMYSQLRALMQADVGCTVPWLPDKSDICQDEDTSKRAFDLYQKNRRNQHDICPNSCLFTNMYFGPPVKGQANQEDADIARAIFYFRRDIKTTREYFLYSALSMVAEIGGYVGLLLGVSVFKVADVNNVFLDYLGRKKGSKGNSKEDDVQRLFVKRREKVAASKVVIGEKAVPFNIHL